FAGERFGHQLRPVPGGELPNDADRMSVGHEPAGQTHGRAGSRVAGLRLRRLAASLLTECRPGHLEGDWRAFTGGWRQPVDEHLLAVGAARCPSPASAGAGNQHGILDPAGDSFAGPLDTGLDDAIALQADRAMLADPLLDEPLSQSGIRLT